MTARLPVLVVVWAKRPDWFDQARCRGIDPALFHPSRGDERTARQARAVCAQCSVCAACLEHALAYEHHGIWGGTSERQRREMRRP